jgi:hypothetical protein
MRILTMAALVGAQLLAAAQPARAAEFEPSAGQRMGAFGGVRVRLPLDGRLPDRLRAGLTVAPALHSRAIDGESRLQIGEGVEIGLRGHEPLRLRIAGQDLRRLAAQQSGNDEEDDGGIPTGAWIAGGIVLVAVAGVVFVAIALDNASDD